MTPEEAIELFKKAHSLKEQLDMQNDINDINRILTSYPVCINEVRNKINSINEAHPENIMIYNIIYSPVGNSVPLNYATADNLICDLNWKRNFLIAKKNAKLFEEFCKEMKK